VDCTPALSCVPRSQRLRYGQSCLLSLFYVAISVVLSQDVHVGARIMGCAGLLGPAWIGLVMTGSLVSLGQSEAAGKASWLEIHARTCSGPWLGPPCHARRVASQRHVSSVSDPAVASLTAAVAVHELNRRLFSHGIYSIRVMQSIDLRFRLKSPSCQCISRCNLRFINSLTLAWSSVMLSPGATQSLATPQLSLAHAPGVAYTTFLCIFVCLGILLAVLLRACGNPAIAGSGLALQFFYGRAASWQHIAAYNVLRRTGFELPQVFVLSL